MILTPDLLHEWGVFQHEDLHGVPCLIHTIKYPTYQRSHFLVGTLMLRCVHGKVEKQWSIKWRHEGKWHRHFLLDILAAFQFGFFDTRKEEAYISACFSSKPETEDEIYQAVAEKRLCKLRR